MGRHQLARKRRRSPAALAAGIASVAAYFAVAADVNAVAAREDAKSVGADTSSCCIQIAAAQLASKFDTSQLRFNLEQLAPETRVQADRAQAERPRADRSRADLIGLALPVGIALEDGLQVNTIRVSRNISMLFPEIHEIGGVRPDALRWHPDGLALDVMIPDPSSAAGIELGNAIVAFVLENADRFGIQDAIWRGVYYTPGGGAQSGGYGHYDHVHVTTTGGGYPSGEEIYAR